MFEAATPLFGGLLTALGVGLLIGLVRERRRNDPESGPSAAGLRTHALASIAAATAWHLDPRAFLVLFAIGGALIAVSYRRTAESDVGLTGEFALVTTLLLGALAMDSTTLAAGLGVLSAILLHLRNQLHHLGRELISETEVRDGLLLAAAALIVLPILPREPVDPWGVLVPSALWKLVVLVMAAGMAGQVALRMVGARFGLPVAGFFAGFASSTAATASYGQRAKDDPALLPYAASAAIFANLATLLLLVAVLASGSATVLRAAAWPLLAAGTTLLVSASAGLFDGRALASDLPPSSQPQAFKLSHALALAAFVAVVLVVSALLAESVGDRGALAAAAVAGMVELQGAALAIGQLAETGRLAVTEAKWGLVLLLASSGTVKSVLAFGSGGGTYGRRVAFGLGASVTAAALAAWWTTG